MMNFIFNCVVLAIKHVAKINSTFASLVVLFQFSSHKPPCNIVRFIVFIFQFNRVKPFPVLCIADEPPADFLLLPVILASVWVHDLFDVAASDSENMYLYCEVANSKMAVTARRNTSVVRYKRSASVSSSTDFHSNSRLRLSIISACFPVSSRTVRSMRYRSSALCWSSNRIASFRSRYSRPVSSFDVPCYMPSASARIVWISLMSCGVSLQDFPVSLFIQTHTIWA